MLLFKKIAFFILLPVFFGFTINYSLPEHEFHVSKCLIEYNEKEQALQITLHLFIDDLEEALRLQGADKLFICTEKEHEEAEGYIAKYLQQKFTVGLEGKVRDYHFLGKEISEDLMAVWCYLEIENVPDINQLHVKNALLMDAFDDQKNIIRIVGPQKKKAYFLFNQTHNEEILNFSGK